MPAWILKPSFKQNLFLGIFKNQKLQDAEKTLESAAAAAEQAQSFDSKFIEKLDNYSSERWEVMNWNLFWAFLVQKLGQFYFFTIQVNIKIYS